MVAIGLGEIVYLLFIIGCNLLAAVAILGIFNEGGI